MPYLPAQDEVVSFDRFSSRGFWKWYNSEVWRFLNGDYRDFKIQRHDDGDKNVA